MATLTSRRLEEKITLTRVAVLANQEHGRWTRRALFRVDEVRGNLSPAPKLICPPDSHYVTFVQIAKDLDQVVGPDAGRDVNPFGTILVNTNHETALKITGHRRKRAASSKFSELAIRLPKKCLARVRHVDQRHPARLAWFLFWDQLHGRCGR